MADNDALQAWLDQLVTKHGFSETGGGTTTLDAPDADLQAEYEKLGGDEKLLKLLALEDDAWRKNLEIVRAKAMERQKRRLRQIVLNRDHTEGLLGRYDRTAAIVEDWLSKEKPKYEALAAEVKALGPKLATEPGKQLEYDLDEQFGYIDYLDRDLARDKVWAPKARAVVASFDAQKRNVEERYEAVEQKIRDSRTELNNALELRAMTLAEKLERVRGGDVAAGEKAMKKLQADLDKVFEDGNQEDREVHEFFITRLGDHPPTPIDWSPIRKQLADLQQTSLDELKQPDPKLEKLKKAYEKAGGDEKLYKLRMKAWKEDMEGLRLGRSLNGLYMESDGQDQQKVLVDAEQNLTKTLREVRDAKARLREIEARLEQLTSGAATGELLSDTEANELKLLTRERERLETDLENSKRLVAVYRRTIEDTERLLEEERRLHEHNADDDHERRAPKPTEADILKLPLAKKYKELKSAG